MRPIPIITAILTVALLFMLVFQRDALRSFVGNEPAAPQAEVEEVATPEAAKRISVVALKSVAQEIDSAVILRGETDATRSVTVVSETSGRVISPMIAKGTMVDEGQLLCEVDPGTRQIALSQAEAQLAEADRALKAAEALAKDGFAAETRVLNARAAFQSAQAGVDQAREALDNLEMTAPFAGLLIADTPEVSTLLQPGAQCAQIVQLDPIRLVGSVSEAEVSRVSEGAQVGARLTTGEQVVGRVTYVGRSADPITRTFRVEAEAANTSLSIRDGQTVDILIASAGRTAHLLPQSALTLNDGGDLGVRIVGDGDIARFSPVELVRDSVDGVWVAGLPDEAAVIVIGQDYVRDGVEIDVSYKESGT